MENAPASSPAFPPPFAKEIPGVQLQLTVTICIKQEFPAPSLHVLKAVPHRGLWDHPQGCSGGRPPAPAYLSIIRRLKTPLQEPCLSESSVSAGARCWTALRKRFPSLASISCSGSEVPLGGEQLSGTTSNCLPWFICFSRHRFCAGLFRLRLLKWFFCT